MYIKLFFSILIIIIITSAESFPQYFVMSKINEDDVNRKILKENNVRKIIIYNKYNDKIEERYIDNNGFVSECKYFRESESDSLRPGYIFDSLYNEMKNYNRKIITKRDNLGRETEIIEFEEISSMNEKDSIKKVHIMNYLPGNIKEEFFYHSGKLIFKNIDITDSSGNIIESVYTTYNDKSEYKHHARYKFDKYNNEIESESVDYNEKLLKEYNYENNELKIYLLNSKSKQYIKYVTYDNNKNIETAYDVSKEGNKNLNYIMEFNSNGQVIKKIEYFKDYVNHKFEVNYVNNGLPGEKSYYFYQNYPDNKEEYIKKYYDFDAKGNLIRYLIIKNGDIVSINTYKYYYF